MRAPREGLEGLGGCCLCGYEGLLYSSAQGYVCKFCRNCKWVSMGMECKKRLKLAEGEGSRHGSESVPPQSPTL